MKNTFGNNISVTLFGESHGPYIGAVIDGLAPGVSVDEDTISYHLSRRRPQSAVDTPRREKDNFRIVSGVMDGKSCGTPVTIIIPNENTKSSDYTYGPARPAHADYAAHCKYHGFEDYRGGGHFSGRITAAIVAAGGILIPALEGLGIRIGTHIHTCAGVKDAPFDDLSKDIPMLREKMFPVLDDAAGAEMTEKILEASKDGDSVGGVIETAVTGMPAGVGEPWFDTLESMLSHAMFSIGAVKGIEFGSGFEIAGMRGSQANDPIRIKDGRVYTETNNNGGINGGISNGMPIVFRCAVKPTPSISTEQKTIDFVKGENIDHTLHGRHDPAIVRRACPVADAMTAIVLADALAGRYGTDVFTTGFHS